MNNKSFLLSNFSKRFLIRPHWGQTRTFPQDIFTDRALDDIYKESTGIPRRINRICEKSLMYASQQGKRLIDEHLVRYIIEHEMLGGDV